MPSNQQPFRQNIEIDGDIYMVRYHLTPWRWWPFQTRLLLHVFHRPDAERHLHDHPFDFRSIILWGGYAEIIGVQSAFGEVIEQRRTHGMFSSYKADAPFRHRITHLFARRTTTLVFRGPKYRDWGFYPDNEFVRWNTYLDLPDDLPSAYA